MHNYALKCLFNIVLEGAISNETRTVELEGDMTFINMDGQQIEVGMKFLNC